MNVTPASNVHAQLVQLTRAAHVFDDLANGLIQGLRIAMNVPQNAGADVEREFGQLREQLDEYFPEFQEIYGSTLVEHFGVNSTDRVLAALSGEGVQAYFRKCFEIDCDFVAALPQLADEMAAVADEIANG
jgi:hypothetical protein